MPVILIDSVANIKEISGRLARKYCTPHDVMESDCIFF